MSDERGFRREIGSTNGSTREDAEEPLDLVHPRSALRREVKLDPWMFRQPVPDLRRLMGRRVVENDVECLARGFAIELLEKLEEVFGRVRLLTVTTCLSL